MNANCGLLVWLNCLTVKLLRVYIRVLYTACIVKFESHIYSNYTDLMKHVKYGCFTLMTSLMRLIKTNKTSYSVRIKVMAPCKIMKS